ncbi:MAG: DUF488 domain-containing protein [Anaerolineae bacterium]|jgi:uncharacterized protein (DUF488 family)|nr:DUF488 domain-containing protein [Anaerolineae bacterium]MDX9831558.1 DUF488 domain-containing protein [Anaerolineae bacterium]
MPTVCTIGTTQKSLEQFIRLLQGAGVDAVVDVRLRNTSQLAGFAKRDDLAFLLTEGFGIQYEHRPDLAPTAEIMDAYKAGRDWPAYEREFLALLAQRGTEEIGHELLARYRCPCLLCAEPQPHRCHRRLVAEWWARHIPGLEVVHLV